MEDDRILAPLAAGLMLVAGVLHLLMAPPHLAHARGAGLFFIVMGAAQIVWAFVYMRDPAPRHGTIGLAFLILMPVVLYIMTRVYRAPWHATAETVDAIGLTTQFIQLAAAVPLFMQWKPQLPAGSTTTVAVIGISLGLVGYGGAMVGENVAWLSEGEDAHGDHGHGDTHGGDHADGHGDHGDLYDFGTPGVSLVGTMPNYGPSTGREIADQCRSVGAPNQDCWNPFLKDILVASGSVVAFYVLEELMAIESEANEHSHAIAHDLGRFAYQAYGYDITLTLAECSYDVFQGCLHGALQFFFDDVAAQGGELDQATMRSTCAGSQTDFEIYACLHGVGHGVMLYTNYKLHESLDLCALLEGWYAQESCYGGVYMENVVGYADSLSPTAAGGHHGHGGHDEPPTFWVDPDVPEYPCNVVDDRYGDACWRMQTSLILRFNGGDFRATSEVCEEKAGKFRLACFNSVGRDAAPYTNRDPLRMSQHCSYGDAAAQRSCVEGFSAGEVLQNNDPDAGFVLCGKLPVQHKDACYTEVGQQAGRMWSDAQTAEFCATAPGDYEASCRKGARLD